MKYLIATALLCLASLAHAGPNPETGDRKPRFEMYALCPAGPSCHVYVIADKMTPNPDPAKVLRTTEIKRLVTGVPRKMAPCAADEMPLAVWPPERKQTACIPHIALFAAVCGEDVGTPGNDGETPQQVVWRVIKAHGQEQRARDACAAMLRPIF